MSAILHGIIAACGLALVAGCTTVPEPAAPPSALRLTPSDDIAPNFIVPDVRARMVNLARQEWALFGRPVVRDNPGEATLEFPVGAEWTHEVQGPMLSRVMMYWYAVTRDPIVGFQGELRPWSAAFISWVVRSAGVSAADFPPTVLHWDYIEHALKNGEAGRFVARDIRGYAPKIGDLVCAPRASTFGADLPSFATLRHGGYHCDLVVEVRADELDAIGGNVLDTVAMTRIRLDAEGRVVPSAQRPWVAVIEQR